MEAAVEAAEARALRAASSGFCTDTNAPDSPRGGGTGARLGLPAAGAAAAMLESTTEGGARRLAPPSPDRVRECPRAGRAVVKFILLLLSGDV